VQDKSQAEKRINIPLTAEIHLRLQQQARSLGLTQYELAAKAVEAAVENKTVEVVTDPSLGDVKVRETLDAIGGDAGALASIARHYKNLDKQNLAAVLLAAAADLLARPWSGEADPARAARELVRWANDRLVNRAVKIALLERAVDIDPAYVQARNLLGQQLYFDGQYTRAESELAMVRDNRARLFHGWSVLKLAKETRDRNSMTRGRAEIAEALEEWCLGNRDPDDRRSWITQVALLLQEGEEFAHTVDELVEYARNADWKERVTRADVDARAAELGGSQPGPP
jgi:hypothetical protein